MIRGGTSEERLYLRDEEFRQGGKLIRIRKTAMPDIDSIIARHKARYHLVAFFCRPGMRVLDFPCGSGYGAEVLESQGVQYEGYDLDAPTIAYCNKLYSGSFYVGDMTSPSLVPENYDIIACMEGIEHIGAQFQKQLIKAFSHALKPNGNLIISCPETPKETSGPSDLNPFHLWELTYLDFHVLLSEYFSHVQTIFIQDTLHNGSMATCMYGICRRGN